MWLINITWIEIYAINISLNCWKFNAKFRFSELIKTINYTFSAIKLISTLDHKK